MANTTSVGFKKYASKPTADSSISKGDIVFVTGEKTIYVAADDTVASLVPFYGGEVKNATFTKKASTDTEPSQLTFTYMDGTHLTLDFSDIASISNVDDLITALETKLNNSIASVANTAGTALETANVATSTANTNKTDISGLKLAYDDDNKTLRVVKKDGTTLGDTIDVTKFVVDGMLSDAQLVTTAETGITIEVPYIKLTFNSDAGKQDIRFSVKDLVDTYTAGNGLTLSNNQFSVKAVAPIVADASGVQLKYNDTLVKDTNSMLGVNQTGVESWIDAKINALDANPEGSSSQGIKVQVTQTNGKVSGVSVSQSQSFVTDVVSGAVDLLTTKNTNNVVTVTPKVVSISVATTTNNGLAVAADVKSYVDTHITSAFTWGAFE